ncbi:MAG: hypothetical protein ACK4WH_04400 [Phycisphaerales bacterium]
MTRSHERIHPLVRRGAQSLLMLTAVFAASVALGGPAPARPGLAARAEAVSAELNSALELGRTSPIAARTSLERAVDEITALIRTGDGSDRDLAMLLFNRGLARAQLGDHAASLLDFLRSDALHPSPQARDQAVAMRQRVRQSADPASSATAHEPQRASQAAPLTEQVSRLVRSTPVALWWWTGVTAWAVGWIAVGVRILRGPYAAGSPPRIAVVLAFATAAVGLGGAAGLDTFRPGRGAAVVLGEACEVRDGPDSVAYPARPFEGRSHIPKGRELRVLEQRDVEGHPGWAAWFRVVPIDDLTSGADTEGVWVRADQVGLVWPARQRPPSAN